MCDPADDDDRPFDIVRDYYAIEVDPDDIPDEYGMEPYKRAFAEERDRARAIKARLAAEDAARRNAS